MHNGSGLRASLKSSVYTSSVRLSTPLGATVHQKWPPSTTEVVFAYFMCPAEHSDKCRSAQGKWPPGTPKCCLYASGARLCTPRIMCASQKSALRSMLVVEFWHPPSYPSPLLPPLYPSYLYVLICTSPHPVLSADMPLNPRGVVCSCMAPGR